jgi:hypothetical protein
MAERHPIHRRLTPSFRSRSYIWVIRNQNSRQNVMRRTLEHMFGRSFPTVRPAFLVNPETGCRLELDCYCESLGLAAEFDGIQHHIYPNPFHSTLTQFEAQQRRDAYKVRMCEERGIRLVVIPYTVERNSIASYLRHQLIPHTEAGTDAAAVLLDLPSSTSWRPTRFLDDDEGID